MARSKKTVAAPAKTSVVQTKAVEAEKVPETPVKTPVKAPVETPSKTAAAPAGEAAEVPVKASTIPPKAAVTAPVKAAVEALAKAAIDVSAKVAAQAPSGAEQTQSGTEKASVKAEPEGSVQPVVEKSVVVEFGGRQIVAGDILAQAEKAYAESNPGTVIKTIELYISPEQNAAYYVVNGEGSDSFRIEL